MNLFDMLENAKIRSKTMTGKVERKCRCGNTFFARQADINRGWGKFCSKSCKAKEQESRTHQHADHHYSPLHGRRTTRTNIRIEDLLRNTIDSDGNDQRMLGNYFPNDEIFHES